MKGQQVREAAARRRAALWVALGTMLIVGVAVAGKPSGGGGGSGGGGKTRTPAITVSPSSLDFGDQLVSTTSAARSISVSNSGRADLVISGVSNPGGGFSQTNNCVRTLVPGAGCTISVTFSPSAAGTATVTLVITSNAPTNPTSVSLSGNGTTLPAVAVRVEGAGDSIMRGYNASCLRNDIWGLGCYSGGDQDENSYLDGWSSGVTSIVDHYVQLVDPRATGGKAASESGSEMRDAAKNNFATQAAAIVGTATQPVRVFVELGGNDLCNRAAIADLYTDAQWEEAVHAGLGILTQGLPDGSTVLMVSVPRVQDLRAVGIAKQNSTSNVNCESFWSSFGVCRIATASGADLAQRLAALEERQQSYNRILVELAGEYNTIAVSTGVEVVAEFDAELNASVGSYAFQTGDINGGDCFHPSIQGQNKLSDILWGNNPYK